MIPPAARARLAYHLRRFWRHPEAATWDDLAAILRNGPQSTVSIDVFDTVVYRTVVGDQNVERVVCDRVAASGLWDGTGEDLFAARQAAKQGNEGSSALSWFEAAGVADPQAALDVEIAVEAELCRAVPGASKGLTDLRAHGKRIVFLSDMHLPASALARILGQLGLLQPADEVVSSSDEGNSKAGGTLYELVADRLGLDAYIHAGNSRWVDVAMCEAVGYPSVHFTQINPTRYETAFAESGVLGGILAGAAREARLRASAGAPKDKVLTEVGTGVAGLALGAFTLWIRQMCREAGIDQVAYCARDGELPLRMSEAMPAELGWAERVVYLHGNRRSWLVAGVAPLGLSTWLEVGMADKDAVLRHGIHNKPLAASLERLALTHSEVPRDLRVAQLDPALPIPTEDAEAWTELCADPRIHRHLESAGQLLVDDLRRYLDALGIMEGTWALVDVGWRGQLAAMVSATIEGHTGRVPHHLHFGARGIHAVTEALLQVDRFAFDGLVRHAPCENIVSAVETITGSGGPRAVGFARDVDGDVWPVLSDPIEPIDTPERRELWRNAIEVASLLPCSPSLLGYYDETEALGDPASEVFRLYWLEPTDVEAEVLGSFCFELDEAGEVVIPIGAPYELGRLFRNDVVAPRQWRNGSLAITPQPLQTALRIGDRLQRLIRPETRG